MYVTEPDTDDDSVVTVCFNATVILPRRRDAVFELVFNNGTTTATLDVDFSLNSTLITIPSGTSGYFSDCVDLVIVGDNTIEEDELVVYDLVPLSYNDSVIFPEGLDSISVTILDNDGKGIIVVLTNKAFLFCKKGIILMFYFLFFSSIDFSVVLNVPTQEFTASSEGDVSLPYNASIVEFCVDAELNRTLNRDASFLIVISNSSTATADEDYAFGGPNFIIETGFIGNFSMCVNISIFFDSLVEYDEQIIFEVVPEEELDRVNGPVQIVNIIDDDSKSLLIIRLSLYAVL